MNEIETRFNEFRTQLNLLRNEIALINTEDFKNPDIVEDTLDGIIQACSEIRLEGEKLIGLIEYLNKLRND